MQRDARASRGSQAAGGFFNGRSTAGGRLAIAAAVECVWLAGLAWMAWRG